MNGIGARDDGTSAGTSLGAMASKVGVTRRWMALAAVGLLVGACGASEVTLRRIVANQERMSGRRVVVSGRVVAFEDPDGTMDYILEDYQQNRVLLLPDDIAADYVGRQIEVTGLYEFDPGQGRVLWVEEIRPKEPPGG